MKDDTALFWSRVDVRGPDDCWLWGFHCDSAGYGTVRISEKMWKAHRVAYTLAVGEIPLGGVILHSCDVRACCNPAHLTLGTQVENIAEMMARGRYKAVGDSHRACLSVERKRELREAHRIALFWSKVDRRDPDECWEWQAHRDKKGYGRVGVSPSKSDRAYRVAYRMAHGVIPDGLCVLHGCDNPPCVNPAHLFLGTRADNNADMVRKGRSRPGDMPSGERHHNAKLTERDVLEVRAAYAAGNIRLKDLAARFGVAVSVVCEVVNRKAWAHVP